MQNDIHAGKCIFSCREINGEIQFALQARNLLFKKPVQFIKFFLLFNASYFHTDSKMIRLHYLQHSTSSLTLYSNQSYHINRLHTLLYTAPVAIF